MITAPFLLCILVDGERRGASALGAHPLLLGRAAAMRGGDRDAGGGRISPCDGKWLVCRYGLVVHRRRHERGARDFF